MNLPVLINDPYPAAFLVAAGYLGVSVLCLRAMTSEKVRSIRLFWGSMGALLFVFGINKQLNLHQILLRHAKKTPELLVAMAVIAVFAAVAASVLAAHLVRNPAPGVRRTLAATFVLLLFLGVKIGGPGAVAAFVNMDLTTDKEDLFHIHLIEVIQIIVLTVIGKVAWDACKRALEAMPQTAVEQH